MAIPMTIEEQILYWLSLDLQVRALAERLLQRFAVTVGDLPASAAHHHAEPGGLYRHSLEVALKALEEFEGSMKMERRPDGSVDSFRSSRNRSRWQYATFIAALCHDLGKLFDLEVRSKARPGARCMSLTMPLVGVQRPWSQAGVRTGNTEHTPGRRWRFSIMSFPAKTWPTLAHRDCGTCLHLWRRVTARNQQARSRRRSAAPTKPAWNRPSLPSPCVPTARLAYCCRPSGS
jgi:Putative helicase